MERANLVLDAATVENALAVGAMTGGREHRVAFMTEEGRVLKVANAHALSTESVYDYLTDFLLSNYFFEDDVQLLGCFDKGGQLHIMTSQPYVAGIHPEWPELKAGLVSRGLIDPEPNALGGNFEIDDPIAGRISVIDLHRNNVMQLSNGRMQPIDAHFYFDDRPSRMAALKALGLDTVVGPTDLALRLEDNESDFFKS